MKDEHAGVPTAKTKLETSFVYSKAPRGEVYFCCFDRFLFVRPPVHHVPRNSDNNLVSLMIWAFVDCKVGV